MSIELSSVQRLRVAIETTFATDGTMSIGDFVDVPANEGSVQAATPRDTHDPGFLVQSRMEGREHILGVKKPTLAFTVNLAPTGTAAGSATAAVQGALGRLLKAVMGGEKLGTGTTFAAGSTTTLVNVTSATGFEAGAGIGWVNTSGVLETREIESIATNAITLKHAFSGAPAAAAVAYASATYFMTENPSSTLQFFLQGVEEDDNWLIMGAQALGGMTVGLDMGGLPTVAFNFTGADFRRKNEITNVPAFAAATYTNYAPIAADSGSLRIFTVGTSALTDASLVHASAIEFTPKVNFVAVPSVSGTNTVYKWRAGRANPPAEGSFTTFFESLEWFTDFESRADKAIAYQMGVTAGATVLLTAPTVQVINPQRADANEIASQTVTWMARRDTDTANATTEIAKSPFRIHLF